MMLNSAEVAWDRGMRQAAGVGGNKQLVSGSLLYREKRLGLCEMVGMIFDAYTCPHVLRGRMRSRCS